jgi:predicted adenylyl cyclase CyaB
MNDTLLTTKEAADYLKVHWQTIRNYLNKGLIPYSKAGKNIRIRQHDLDAFLEGRKPEKNQVELELRYKVKDRITLENSIISLGGRVAFHAHVVDRWYTQRHVKNMDDDAKFYESPEGFTARIRQQDSNYSGNIVTTMETKKLVDAKDHSAVIETEIPIDNVEDGRNFLRTMNLKEILTIDKDRVMYKYKDFKIVIDGIKGVGNFSEIELNSFSTKKRGLQRIKSLAKKIGLGQNDLLEKSATNYIMHKHAKF